MGSLYSAERTLGSENGVIRVVGSHVIFPLSSKKANACSVYGEAQVMVLKFASNQLEVSSVKLGRQLCGHLKDTLYFQLEEGEVIRTLIAW